MAKFSVKSITLASVLIVGSSGLAKAQEINSYEDFKLYCSDAAYQYNVQSSYCDEYRPYYQQQLQEELYQQNIQYQDAEINRRNTNQTDIEGYAGITLGAFFPDQNLSDEQENFLVNLIGTDDILNTGFGGSIFIGAKWNKYVGTDLEFIYLGGSTEFDDVDYSVWGLAINPRFFIPFTRDANSISLFISPGLGISTAELDRENINFEDETRLTWQIKAGLSFPIQEQYNAFLQVRYASQFEEDTINFFGTEIGFSINF